MPVDSLPAVGSWLLAGSDTRHGIRKNATREWVKEKATRKRSGLLPSTIVTHEVRSLKLTSGCLSAMPTQQTPLTTRV